MYVAFYVQHKVEFFKQLTILSAHNVPHEINTTTDNYFDENKKKTI